MATSTSAHSTLPRDALRQTIALVLLVGVGWTTWWPARAWVLGPPAPAAAAYVDSALTLMRAYSYRSGQIDWPALRAATLRRAAGAASPVEAASAVAHAARALGDRHSFLMPAGRPYRSAVRRPAQARRARGSHGGGRRRNRPGDRGWRRVAPLAGALPVAVLTLRNLTIRCGERRGWGVAPAACNCEVPPQLNPDFRPSTRELCGS